MSFNLGSIFLAPGESARLILTFSAPGDHGAQWMMAHAEKGQPPCELILTEPSKRLAYSIGWINSEGDSGFEEDSFFYDYRVTVRNAGSQGVVFSVQGGGNT